MANHIDTALWKVTDGLLTEAQDVLENEILERTSALIGALIGSGWSGQAFTSVAKSGSWGSFGASCASDFAPTLV